jgi:hypothetical protein
MAVTCRFPARLVLPGSWIVVFRYELTRASFPTLT